MPSELTYLPICGPCIRGEGSECHTPCCALWLRDVPPDGLISEFALDLSGVRREGAAELDPAYRDIEVCPCSTPGWTHHTGFHHFMAYRVERAVKARAEAAEQKVAAVGALADQWEFGVPDAHIERGAVVDGLRAALRGDA